MQEVNIPSSDRDACLVLMLKAPARSKTRLSAEIGGSARTVAEHLCECAFEDMHEWSGPLCFAPATHDDTKWLTEQDCGQGIVVEQCRGNLGERINHVNRILVGLGHERQVFIGTDCPTIDGAYLSRARTSLASNDVVLGPATDGGVVLMGICGIWPDLDDLPWSTTALMEALAMRCGADGKSIDYLATLHDIDSLHDLMTLRDRLNGDPRAARRAFGSWLAQSSPIEDIC